MFALSGARTTVPNGPPLVASNIAIHLVRSSATMFQQAFQRSYSHAVSRWVALHRCSRSGTQKMCTNTPSIKIIRVALTPTETILPSALCLPRSNPSALTKSGNIQVLGETVVLPQTVAINGVTETDDFLELHRNEPHPANPKSCRCQNTHLMPTPTTRIKHITHDVQCAMGTASQSYLEI